RRRRDRRAEPVGPARQGIAHVHAPRDGNPRVLAAQHAAARVARRAVDSRLGLRPLGRDRDAHRGHPRREAAAQDRARRQGAAQPDYRARRGLQAPGERVMRGARKRFDERALKIVLAAFFLALAIPAGVLIAQAYDQLKWQAFRSAQVAAEELAARIDSDLRVTMRVEDGRSFGAYSFLVVEGDAAANFVQRSPLSIFPVNSALPGVLGWFQVDAAGNLTTPLLPAPGVAAADCGITPAEQAQRVERVAQLRELLAQNQLVRAARDEPPARSPAANAAEKLEEEGDLADARGERRRTQVVAPAVDAPAASPPASIASTPSAQEGFDELARQTPQEAGGAQSQSLDERAEIGAAARGSVVAVLRSLEENDIAASERQKRVEQALVAEPVAIDAASRSDADENAPKAEVAVRTFASEIDPFELGVLDTDHLVLFRNV